MESADCAIGYEAANMVYKGAIGFKDDYVEHIMYHRCLSTVSYTHLDVYKRQDRILFQCCRESIISTIITELFLVPRESLLIFDVILENR